MTAPRWFDDETTALMGERARVRRLERRPATGATTTPTWFEVELLNSWAAAGSPFFSTAHRSDKLVESDDDFRGTLDATAATSGTVAFVVEVANRPEADFSFLMDLDTGGGTFTIGRVVVSSSTGEVTVYFP